MAGCVKTPFCDRRVTKVIFFLELRWFWTKFKGSALLYMCVSACVVDFFFLAGAPKHKVCFHCNVDELCRKKVSPF